MKERRLYWRKKGKSIVLEGRLDNNNPILIWTLPEANRFIKLINEKASLFEQEKLKEINEKVLRLAFRPEKIRKQRQEVRPMFIKRTDIARR